ncbi:MAG: DUF4157 domain-containing protein [Chitinophagaceae bacterium]|nr:DUF4157 domain-containing protein [Chitinophagaceae bacterium]
MGTGADKVTKTTTPVQRQADQSSFFQKKGEGGFFGSTNENGFFSGARIQAKLSVSSPDDPQEKEADAMADQVMRMTEPASAPGSREEEKVQKKGIAIQPKCASCEEDKAQPKIFRMVSRTGNAGMNTTVDRKDISLHHSDVIQRSGRGPPASSTSFEDSLSSSKGGGTALPGDTRQFMEDRFNADFSGVRIHTGNHAESMSSQINAQAFTHGNDIYFNNGKYSPDTSQGSTLLAHELTHTIQQGASSHNSSPSSSSSTVSAKPISVSRKEIIHRSADGVPSQLTNAVAKAKTVEGKIDANKPQGDGFRTGWEKLVEIFKTTFGEEMIVSSSGGGAQGTVAEEDIKKKRETEGAVVDKTSQTDRHAVPTSVMGTRDAMPSWCGIFVFWALNKSGVPMPKWKLGERMIKPEAARAPGSMPMPGDIAYRNAFSHFAIVESVSGGTVKTVNGNTAGEDNLGGQVQTKEHPLADWTAFFNPLLVMQGTLGSGDGLANEKPKTMAELRKDLLKVNRKEEENSSESDEAVQTKPELSNWSVDSRGKLNTNNNSVTDRKVQSKEEPEQQDDKQGPVSQPVVQRKQAYDVHCKCKECSGDEKEVQPKHNIQRKTEIADSSLNSYINAGTTGNSMEMDRGPPSQVESVNEGDNVIHRSVIDDALEYTSLGALMDCVYITDLNKTSVCLLGMASDVAMHIPGYKALRVVLAKDPITGNAVERNGRNFIEAAFDIMPGGELLHKKLDEQHQLDAAAAWIDGKIADLESIVNSLFSRFDQFWNRLGITDFSSPFDVLSEGFGIVVDFIADIIRFAVDAAKELLEMVKKFLLDKIVEFIKEKTTAYPLLTVILGEDPVTKQKVDRNGTNILNAILELGGEEGRMQRDQMQDTGTFQKAAAYIDEGIAVFSTLYQTIVENFGKIWDFVSIDALMNPVETFTQIYNIFAQPVIDVLDFMGRVVKEILKLIKDVLFKRISEEAKKTRGYYLITVLIGEDPFTDEPVPATMENIIHGFMSLMDGGEEQFQQMKESGAIERTTQKITAAVKKLNMTPEAIVQLFIDLWNSFTFSDFLRPIETFQRIIATFGEPIVRLIAFVIEIVKIVVEVILIIMNFPFDLINKIIANAMKAFHLIKADPIGFLKNLLRAIKEGFIQFFDNILQHLVQGLVGWLTMELKDAGVPELKDLSLKGIISWVLEVLGITMEKVWEKLAKHPKIGPAKVAKIRSAINTLEGIWTFIKDVQERGMAAIWDKIQEQLSNLWNVVLDAVKNWIMEKIITQITVKLLSMLDPTGIMAVVNSCIAIYKAIQSFIKYLRQMLEIVSSFVEGVAEIASGNTKKAADFLERTLARGIPIVIGFLANQVGLSGIGKKIGEMIEKAREMVDKGIEWLVNKCVDTAFGVIDKIMGRGRADTGEKSLEEEYGPEKAAKINAGLKTLHDLEQPLLTSDKLTKEEAEQIAATVKQQHPVFTSFTVVDGGDEWDYEYTASKKTKVTGKKKDIGTVPAMVVSPPFSGTKTTGAMTVTYLYSDAANHTEGTPTTGRESLDGAFEAIQAAGQSSYWSRGHVLNKDFGGQAVTSNLIPITQSINRKQVAFDNKIRAAYGKKEAPIFVSFDISRHPDDKFVSSYTGSAVKMKKSGENWTQTGGESLGQFDSGTIELPGAGPKRSIKSLSSSSTTAEIREVGKANNLSVSLLQDIIASGKAMNSGDDIRKFIEKNKDYSDVKKQRYLNRIDDAVLDFSAPGGGASVSPKCEKCDKEDKEKDPQGFEQTLSSSKGSGHALPDNTRTSMEDRFDADFSGVRVHTDDQARNMNKQISSQAFTHGNDIYFNDNKYAPDTEEGGGLLAHELTHTIQQGASQGNVQRKTSKPVPVANPPAQATSLTTGTFTPTDVVAEYIDAGGARGNAVNVSFGSYASGTIKVRKQKDIYETVGGMQILPLTLSFLQPLVNMGIQPALAVQVKDNQVSGYVTTAGAKGGEGTSAIFDKIKADPAMMKWTGLAFPKSKLKITNQIEGGQLRFEVNDINVKLGGFVDATMNIGISNSSFTVGGSAVVKIKSLAEGNLNFNRDAAGNLKGSFRMQTSIKNFNGVVNGEFLNGIFDIRGEASYQTEKLKGTVNIIVTDARQAQTLVLQQLEPQQISKEAEERAGVNDPAAGPQPGPRAIAGWGTLEFSFNKWLTGMAKVIVDAEGYVTVHGEITPPAEITLFKPKPYRSPNFVDLHPTFRWGIPYVADLHVGLDFLLYAEAQIGPAVLRDIKVIGNYSTDPLLFNDFRIQATFNMIGYAGLVFEFGAHAGVGILGFDVDLKGTVKATAGIKGYIDATPVIGYREKADPVEGKKGEFFISGDAELAAQPFLKLAGSVGVAVDSPWPIPNFSKNWPLFEKEWALPGQFGIGMKLNEYVLGSEGWPDVDFNDVKFDEEKFKDDLIERNIPPAQDHPKEKQGGFADKMKGQEPAPPPPPVPVPPKKGKALKEDEKPPTAAVLEKWQTGMKALRELKDKRDEKPVKGEQLQTELKSIRRNKQFRDLVATPSGQNWVLYAAMQGIDNANAPIAIKGLPEAEKPEDEKPGGGKAAADKQEAGGKPLHEKYEPDKAVKISAGIETLHKLEKPLLNSGKITKEEAEQVAIQVKQQHPVFTSFTVTDGGTRWDYLYTASEQTKVKGPAKDEQQSKDAEEAKELEALEKELKAELQPYLDEYNGLTNSSSILVKTNKLETQPEQRVKVKVIGLTMGCLAPCHTPDTKQTWVVDHIPPTELKEAKLITKQTRLYPQSRQKSRQQGNLVKRILELHANNEHQEVKKLLKDPLVKPGTGSFVIASSDSSYTDIEQARIQAIGDETGCHHGGDKEDPADVVSDHIPPSILVDLINEIFGIAITQRLAPSCTKCSDTQGPKVKALARKLETKMKRWRELKSKKK